MNEYDFIGIDIAKNKFDAAVKVKGRFAEDIFENNPAGHQKFVLWLKKHTRHAFACLEATGPYGELLAEYWVKNNIRVSVVNPMQIKHHAKSLLSRNKNDRVDAKIIASYAEKFSPRPFVPKSPDQKFVKEAVQLIDTLNEQSRQLKNQLDSIRSKEIKKEMEKTIRSIETRVSKIEESLKQRIQRNVEYSENKRRILTIIGVGEKTAHRMIAYFPDMSEFKNAKQLAAYAGVSPRQYQSGKFKGKTRISKCGNVQLRKALYMPALVAKNNNPHLKRFCERLEKNGLRPKQIVCAVMRKLLHIIFGILKHKQEFNPALV